MKKLFTLLFWVVLGTTVIAQDIIISEVADPKDDFSARFVELYNPTSSAIDFSTRTLYLVRQANGGNTDSVQLSGTLAAGATYVIANGAANFETAYGFAPQLADFLISGNGDDGYFLYENGGNFTGTLLDAYGELDVDGTDDPWEYLDGRAERVSTVDTPNATWTASEWTITIPANVADFTPGEHGPDVTAPTVTFDPADAATDVAVSTNITLTFDEAIVNADGTEITAPSGLVALKETDASGTDVAFTATIDTDKKVITIDPTADLSNDMTYYVALNANAVEDASGNEIDAVQSASFTTIGAAAAIIEVTYPAGGEFFYPGEEVHIDWNAQNMGNITIWVSFDNGGTFEPIIENIDPAPGTVTYTIPADSPATAQDEGIVLITEATNVTFDAGEPMDESAGFSIFPLLSIGEIQGNTVANGNSVYEDTLCITTGVVSFIGGTSEYYIADGSGSYSGVAVRDNVNKPAVGDSVVVVGTVDEYYGLTQMNSLLSFNNVASGKDVPAPVDLATGSGSEEYEGVVVKLSSAKVVAETNSYGETEVDDGSGVILIDDPYFDATLNLDGTYDITGPLSYSYSKWRVYPGSAADVTEIPSTEATVSSTVYTIDDGAGSITGVAALEDLATFKTNLTPAYGATFEVYQADGTTVATDLMTGYKVIVTAQDGTTTKTYTVTKEALSDDATVTSLVYTVDDGANTITGILFKSNLEDFEALLIPAAGATFVTYQSDGTTEATDVQSGYILKVTAEDGTTTKSYTLTVDTGMPADLIFSEYIEGSGNNKAIELFNPNEEAIRLDYYQIAQMSNGGDAWEYFHVFPAGAVIEPHDVYVILNDGTDDALFSAADADEFLGYPSVVHHNGDDARGLIIVTSVDTTLVDIIGEVGPDPGDGWAVAGIADATKDHTLIRKGTVMEGNTDWAASAGTNETDSEWIVKDQNFFDSLGVHTLVMPEPSDDATLKALTYNGTSVPNFSPAQLTYFVTLEAGTVDIPLVEADATDDNAVVDITPVSDLAGNAAARTATIEVTAEDEVTVKTYTIEFNVEVGIETNPFASVVLYPVPVQNVLQINAATEIDQLTIYDITGATVYAESAGGDDVITLDVSPLRSGVYMIKLENSNASRVVRFIKQ